MKAAALYLKEADRVFAEAAYQFSEARRTADSTAADQAQLSADRKRLARDLHEVAHERQELEMRSRELNQAASSLAARETALKAMESELQQKKGRRRQAEAAPVPAFPDSGPLDLRPNPKTARTPPEFLQLLTAFRYWTGNRSLRQIAEQSGNRISASSVRNILNGTVLPDRLEVIDAIVRGCGGSDEDRADFAAAWRRLYMRPPNGPRQRRPDS